MNVQVSRVPFNEACVAVRREVFIVGQHVPVDIEIDGLDEACVHFLATLNDVPVGTCRLRFTHGKAKAERVAVVSKCRGLGLGIQLMEALEAHAADNGYEAVVLNAQEQVIPFYERQGYTASGPRFFEADIPHRAMSKCIATSQE